LQLPPQIGEFPVQTILPQGEFGDAVGRRGRPANQPEGDGERRPNHEQNNEEPFHTQFLSRACRGLVSCAVWRRRCAAGKRQSAGRAEAGVGGCRFDFTARSLAEQSGRVLIEKTPVAIRQSNAGAASHSRSTAADNDCNSGRRAGVPSPNVVAFWEESLTQRRGERGGPQRQSLLRFSASSASLRYSGGAFGRVSAPQDNPCRARCYFARAFATAASSASPRRFLAMILPSPSKRYVAGMLFTPYLPASLLPQP